PHAGVAVPGDVGVTQRIPLRGEVPATIRQVFEDGRHRARLGIDGQPDAGREPCAVLQRGPDWVEPGDPPRRRRPDGQGVGLYRLVIARVVGVLSAHPAVEGGFTFTTRDGRRPWRRKGTAKASTGSSTSSGPASGPGRRRRRTPWRRRPGPCATSGS